MVLVDPKYKIHHAHVVAINILGDLGRIVCYEKDCYKVRPDGGRIDPAVYPVERLGPKLAVIQED